MGLATGFHWEAARSGPHLVRADTSCLVSAFIQSAFLQSAFICSEGKLGDGGVVRR